MQPVFEPAVHVFGFSLTADELAAIDALAAEPGDPPRAAEGRQPGLARREAGAAGGEELADSHTLMGWA